MALGVALVTFTSGLTTQAADMNTNFGNLNGAISYSGQFIVNGGLSNSVSVGLSSYIGFGNGGTLGGLTFFSGSASGTFNHGLSSTPTMVSIYYSGNFGSAPTQAPAYSGSTSTTVAVLVQTGFTWLGLTYAQF